VRIEEKCCCSPSARLGQTKLVRLCYTNVVKAIERHGDAFGIRDQLGQFVRRGVVQAD
jgi:hypothetical protein